METHSDEQEKSQQNDERKENQKKISAIKRGGEYVVQVGGLRGQRRTEPAEEDLRNCELHKLYYQPSKGTKSP